LRLWDMAALELARLAPPSMTSGRRSAVELLPELPGVRSRPPAPPESGCGAGCAPGDDLLGEISGTQENAHLTLVDADGRVEDVMVDE